MAPSKRSPTHDLPPAPSVGKTEIAIRVLGLSDLHMNIRGYDYFADRDQATAGLARAATLIERLRADAPNSLLFDNGDMLQGNPMGDDAANRHAAGDQAPHPMILALNCLEIDAATLGNHEFNYGLEFLEDALRHAQCPFVSANIATRLGDTPEDDTPFLPPYTILERTFRDGADRNHRLRIGVFGLLPPQVTFWDSKHLKDRLFTRDIVEAARAYVPRMKAEGADLIVALSHSGIDDAENRPGLENASIPLAAIPGLDVIISGHSHLVFPSPAFASTDAIDATQGRLHGTPTVMPGFGGSHVGVVDLVLTSSDAGWQVSSSRVATPRVAGTPADSGPTEHAILTATEDAHQRTLTYIRQPVGEIAEPLHTYFAMLEPSTATRLIATAQAARLATLLRDTDYAGLPLLSAATAFKTGGRGGADNYTHIPAGQISVRNVADLYGYPNMLRALMITGADLRAWLEYAAGMFRQIEPGGDDQPLISRSFPSYNFDTITGVTYRIDLSEPARYDKRGILLAPGAGRIRDLSYKGAPVTDDQRFVVATNDYRASQSGLYPGADDGTPIPIAPEAHRDILIRYFRTTDATRVLAKPPWSFVPITNATAVIETSTGALTYPDHLAALGLSQIGPSEDGVLRFRVPFDRAFKRQDRVAQTAVADGRPVLRAREDG